MHDAGGEILTDIDNTDVVDGLLLDGLIVERLVSVVVECCTFLVLIMETKRC